MNTYESYVPYEAAKQMQALGFSELCHATYDTTTLDREWQVHTGQHVLLSNKISCPTQVQAIDWFIQKYKLFIQVTYETIDGKSGYFCTIVEIGEFENGEPVTRVDSTCYDSRSQATNRGIDFAIGIVFERMSSVKFQFHPENMDEVFEILDKNISGDDKQYLLNNGALHCHHTLGRWIRNSFGLWEQEKSSLWRILFGKGFTHPDDMSNHVLEEYIKHLTTDDWIPSEDNIPYELVVKLVGKGFPARTADEWFCAYDGGPDRDCPITKNHFPIVSQTQVRKWLKKRHNIFIEVSMYDEEDLEVLKNFDNKYQWQIMDASTGNIRPFNGSGTTEYNAINDAIELCVDKLI